MTIMIAKSLVDVQYVHSEGFLFQKNAFQQLTDLCELVVFCCMLFFILHRLYIDSVIVMVFHPPKSKIEKRIKK